MALLTVENLSFSYGSEEVLKNISFSIEEGQFVALCGLTGSGKSTLLRLLKKELQPHGTIRGQIYFEGKPLEQASTSLISYVMQKPDEQLVMEKVWQELAFPLENEAIATDNMQQTIAEVMQFLGIHHLFQQSISSLSGGQKQLVNLAVALVGKPKLLLLDEPTAQLDPLNATHFLQILERIHRELGIAICIVEHRLEELVPIVDEILLLEQKTITKQLPPQQLVQTLTNHPLLRAFGAPAYVFSQTNQSVIPLTVREAKKALTKLQLRSIEFLKQPLSNRALVLEGENLYFRYGKKEKDVIENLHVQAFEKDIIAVFGGNGSGKSTLLHILAGTMKPYKGKIINQSSDKQTIALLPQNPQTILMKNSVEEEFEMLRKVAPQQFEERKQKIIDLFELQSLLHQHPFDLSGGQQQLVAFAKLYCLNTPIVLLDEPTKGLDVQAKQLILQAVQLLQQEGKAIIMVTHDLDFSAECATHCTMLFEGNLTRIQPVRQFFCTNRFYTTAARRMTAHISNAITSDEVITQLRGGTNTNA